MVFIGNSLRLLVYLLLVFAVSLSFFNLLVLRADLEF
jgi:hypothetical protein